MANENKWGSNIAFVLAMIGSAVGLGNIWRYPYVLYSNGGGAFYIPYLLAIISLAIPFLILEYGVGYNYQSSFTKAIVKLKPKFEFYGWILPVVVFIMTVYYSTIIGWDGIYLFLSFFKGWGADPNTYLNVNLLQATDSLSGAFNFIPFIAVFMLVGWFIVWLISHKNLDEGLGRVCEIFVPLLFVVMLFIVIFSLTLPGASIGLSELFNPDWSLLWHFDIWMAAFGQIFFSLSLGMGAGFTYASYTNDDIDLISSGLKVIFANCAFENFAALGVFSILGYMSLQSGTPVSEIVSQGTTLIFVAYPQVFNILGTIGLVLGPLFFFTVYIAGITSMLSSFEVLSISIQNKFALSRRKATLILCIIGGLASMVYATSAGGYILGIADIFVNNIVVILSVFVECILFAWIFKAERLIDFMNGRSKHFKLGKWWLAHVKYIIPILLLVIWFGGLYELIALKTTDAVIVLIVLALILIISSLIFTLLPAKTKEWFKTEERIK
ncbi:sodium-dependent transporter [Methanobrevibacter sp.]|uniref:sodium-dependent transporter n=1 Tax=Methanobrevibacter sp. TaxID=66852 RepID=UPI002E79965A|nr:sodium-dependent transporter [Methanobrevibacter sp.]MEE1336847.1 sodium-dependent transporter [Methanobrevibacter sp.]